MSDWFLPESERPWTSGNLVVPRVHGADYFARLVELVGATEAVPELLGVGAHLMATARRPASS